MDLCFVVVSEVLQDIAVKILREETYQEATLSQKKAFQSMFSAEIQVLARYKHHNLIRLLGSSQDRGNEGKLALVYELCEGRSLYQRLFQQKAGVKPLNLHQRLEYQTITDL